jgi:ABC-type branched-subunit amino acid transport system ATPase component
MYSLLEELKRSMNMTIILIEQNINKAISFCNRCILLSQGTIGKVFENSSEEMRKDIMASLGL